MLRSLVWFEVVEPEPSVEELLAGAWVYYKYRLRMRLLEAAETPTIQDALTQHQMNCSGDWSNLPGRSVWPATGVYEWVGSRLSVG